MSTINPDFAAEIKKYGAKDFEACFNCGNCTAVCDLTDKNANFPRMMIRDGMLGQTGEILESKELWLCYACGECSLKCPRQAGPGDYMAAMRRYSIASYEPTGLTKLIFKSNPFSLIVTLILAVILGFFLLTIKPNNEIARWIFDMMPYEVIHNMGLVIFGFTGLSMAWGLVYMMIRLSKKTVKNNKKTQSLFTSLLSVFAEMATLKRYRNCDSEEDSYWDSKPDIVKPWFVHWTIMWGFLGLLLATILDFIFKDPATDIWLPSRILGSIAGFLMIYGTTLAITYRLKKVTRSYSETRMADWMLLIFLWIAGFTGFWLEISVTVNTNNLINQLVFILHTIVSMELVLLFAFSKFAHALYRPVALFMYFRNVIK